MVTNTSYGSWHKAAGSSSLTLKGDVRDALLAGVDFNDYSDEQIGVVADAYRAAINEALPDTVSLCGDEFYGPYIGWGRSDHFSGYPMTEDDHLDIAGVVQGVDFWGVVEKIFGGGAQ